MREMGDAPMVLHVEHACVPHWAALASIAAIQLTGELAAEGDNPILAERKRKSRKVIRSGFIKQ